MELNASSIDLNPALIRNFSLVRPNDYARDGGFGIVSSTTAAGRRSLLTPSRLSLELIGSPHTIPNMAIDLNVAANWDAISPVNYSVAANRAGKNFYLYATQNRLVVSANATVPYGFTADQVRLIGGFPCLCASAGVLTDHPANGFLVGDIIPNGIWDLLHRSAGLQRGMAYVEPLQQWWMIYLQSGTGASTASVFNGTITDTRIWNDHVDDLMSVGLVLPFDAEFQIAAEGSNQKTNITGSTDPVTTGGHVDTAGRRMISNYFLEDCSGAMYQWLQDNGYQNDSSVYAGGFNWYTIPGNRGSLYRQGAIGDVKLLAGGAWNYGTACGSRSRGADSYRWDAYSSLGSRGCARSHT